jgi:hypothetical protein
VAAAALWPEGREGRGERQSERSELEREEMGFEERRNGGDIFAGRRLVPGTLMSVDERAFADSEELGRWCNSPKCNFNVSLVS